MKKNNQLLILCLILLSIGISCKKDNKQTIIYDTIANFSISRKAVGINRVVTFTNKTNNSAKNHLWDFGDGNTSTDKSPLHKYMKKGIYTVTLVAMNDFTTDTIIMKDAIEVGFIPNTNFEIEIDTPYCTGKPIKFINKSSSETEILSQKWTFISGKTSNEESPTFVYTDEDIHNVILTVTNKYGDSTLTKEINVKGLTIADFYCYKNVAIGENVSFIDTSTYSPTKWTWLFGDGQGSNKQHPTHSYSTAGEYTVTLITENEYGQTYTAKKEIIYVGSMKDINGNKYKTAKVGTQLWMAENLRATSFPDSTEIPFVSDSIAWSELNVKEPAYCYSNGDTNMFSTYGALYNFSATTNNNPGNDSSYTQGVCPEGWHVSSANDWQILGNFITNNGYPDIDGDSVSAEWFEAIKSQEHWSAEQKGTDEYGLSIVPSGGRNASGIYFYVNSAAYLWEDMESSITNSDAYNFIVDYNGENNKTNVGYLSNKSGLSVRCVRDGLAKE